MKKPTILIIEDDQSLATLLNQALESNRFTVSMALDAETGFKKAKRLLPDVIILDIVLPGVNGFVCLEKLRQAAATKHIPVIILSNLGQGEEIRQGLALGAADYLVKADFTISEVTDKILKSLPAKK